MRKSVSRSASKVAVVALLGIVSPGYGFATVKLPRRLVWLGTITTSEALSGVFKAHAHLHFDQDDGNPSYSGRFRCRGSGCPAPVGSVSFTFTSRTGEIDLGFILARHKTVYCVYNKTGDVPPN